MQDIDGDVAEVLSYHGLLPIEEIVTAITDFIPADDVKLCRKYLFESAKGVYYEPLENENQSQTVTLRLKSRRGITARATRARDVVQLFRYISGFVNTFPRDILAAAQCPVHTQTQASYQSETTNTQNDEPIYDNDMTRGDGQADMDIHVSRPITEFADRCRDHGPLTRYVKLQVAHAPGMPGTFSPAADFKGNRKLAIPTCITARAWRTCRDACRDRAPAVTGKTFPAFPAHAHLQFCVSGKRPMTGQSWICKVNYILHWMKSKVSNLVRRTTAYLQTTQMDQANKIQ